MTRTSTSSSDKRRKRRGNGPLGDLSVRLNQKAIDTRARDLRSAIARETAAAFIEEFDPRAAESLIVESPFRSYATDFPDTDPALVLAFNLHVTQRVVRDLCRAELDPTAFAFLVSRATELGTYSLHDPRHPSRSPKVFLGASKEHGYFFTPPDIAFQIAESAIGRRSELEDVLDPSAGTGALLAACMVSATNAGVRLKSVKAIELDRFTSIICGTVLKRIRDQLDLTCEVSVVEGDAVEILAKQALRSDGRRFDCVVMNPPYGRVKFLRDSLTNAETRVGTEQRSLEEQNHARKTVTQTRADYFRQISKALGLGGGAQDFQRLFTALAISVLDESGRIAFIAPSSWLGDRSSKELRHRIIAAHLLEELTLYPEGCGLFPTVNQPTAVTVLSKNGEKDDFSVRLMAPSTSTRRQIGQYRVRFDSLQQLDPQNVRIPKISEALYPTYKRLQAQPRVKDFHYLRNVRGELDLSIGKDLLARKPSQLRLVRGDHIERYILREPDYSQRESYVRVKGFERAFRGQAKRIDITRPRVVGRQCSYFQKGRRLSFALVPPNVVVANSCNYLCLTGVSSETERVVLQALNVILNSVVVEWYFRIFNSNNHVANYEIDDLPLCLHNPHLVEALACQGSFLTDSYSATDAGGRCPTDIEDAADALVAYSFGLTPEEVRGIADEVDPLRTSRIEGMTSWLYEHGIPEALTSGDGWYQHSPPQLSSLDNEIISHVPQGGNWQSVPSSVPSQRLAQIREMTSWRGIVRTTYYGRLRPDQPAYTIATYYNRPGNGTNIHPWEDRTLSSREAARLQSFPDSYIFLGTEGSIRKQVGNAVPPLLARAVASRLDELDGNRTCIDLFAGAGGLSLGLELEGWDVVAAIDNDRGAAHTYQFNRPCETIPDPASSRTLFLDADLTDPGSRNDVLDLISAKLGSRNVGALVGGPPCQGFSHAGWRSQHDKRNDLASIFLSFVKLLCPEVVLLENVEGLMTYKNGTVVRDLMTTLHELGYTTGERPWLLQAERYGTPQMRRRVFLVGTRHGAVLDGPSPLMMPCLGRRERNDSLNLFQELPYPFTVAEAISDLPALGERRHPGMGRREIRLAYMTWAKGLISVEELAGELQANAMEARAPTS